MLTVRNLTPEKITIKCIERFEDPNTSKSKGGGYFFGNRTSHSTWPSAPELGEHAQSFNRMDLDVNLQPFESYTLGASGRNDGAAAAYSSPTLRLTIELPDGVRHRVDTKPDYTQKSAQKFTPLSPGPSETFTALFHPCRPTPHLTIRSTKTEDYSTWMQALPDSLPLSAISIPGTHNSHTYYKALPSVKCQSVDIKTQLDNGIRFLDLRAQPTHGSDPGKKHMYLVHGAFPISLTGPKYLTPVLETCYAFLAANPSESILVSLKREGVGSATDEYFARILQDHYIGPNASKWHTAPTIPYLGAVRGKCILVRRYTTGAEPPSMYASGSGLDATAWPYNCTSAVFPSSSPTFNIQDFCEVLDAEATAQKAQYATQHVARAAALVHPIPGVTTDVANPVPPGPLYLNFLSGSHFWKRACWPEKIATVVNRHVEEWLCAGHHLQVPETTPAGCEGGGGDVGRVVGRKEGDGGTGVLVMDVVGDGGDWDLVRLIVGMNMGVLQKVREGH
ncbi:1-phosphatidylinositol phosphodiesterase precursor [Didymella exigua CBS 183.55]|uniref:1-phosphatidylinositol phosphodiesterase n=1 Tax=Didymella exigua CBS 183.55 TaxID=1150837 RepID=A0A6A5RQF4_9PLEO|nr:1-phosphatidylinositol phosphodiesterase precursor [Didymella exigua CBS 183.55]KAF1930671.1 1-phosphatidylinositol phosphodiesterase precursor [Didymella exigua CBS 183.55]